MRRAGSLAATVLSALAAACASGPTAPETPASGDVAAPAAAAATVDAHPAVAALSMQAREDVAAGDYERAAVALERALRIAPADPALWLELAAIRLQQTLYEEAEALALRSRSLARADETARSAADELLRRIRSAAPR